MSNFIDLTGQKYGRLTVLKTYSKLFPNYKKSIVVCDCICDCGKKITVRKHNLTSGHQKSCTCLRRELTSKRKFIHGKSKSSEHKIWSAMKRRCYNKKDTHYIDYGGRGIKICHKWKQSFKQFFQDMGSRPSPNHSIERRNNNKGYSKNNCCWATAKEQANNKRNNVKFKYKNKYLSISQLLRFSVVERKTLYNRLHELEWNIQKALTKRKMKNHYK